MIDLFDELLSICLDRIADGGTVAECVADFPEDPELEGLLELASALMAKGDEEQRAAGRRATRCQGVSFADVLHLPRMA